MNSHHHPTSQSPSFANSPVKQASLPVEAAQPHGHTCASSTWHKMRRRFMPFAVVLVSLMLFFSQSSLAHGQTAVNPITPLTIRTAATFNSIGVRWEVSGDNNLNSTMTLEFRRLGETDWQAAAPAMRAYPTIRVNGAPLRLNYWGASALFLDPGQTYELRATLTDPDGGDSSEIVTATTRTPLQPDPTGRQLHVVAGNGGGDGSLENPFQGLASAAAAAQAGDTFHLATGTYAPFQLLASGTAEHPIVFLGDGASVVIDGGNIESGIVTLGNFDQPIGYVILEGLIIQNGAWGIDAQRTHNIEVRNNTIQDVWFGYTNRREFGDEMNQTICDNVILGRSGWPGADTPYEQGIDLRGTGNIVCHNIVQHFSDCISVLGDTAATFGNDIFGNDVSRCIDDGIEVDFNQSNVRVWRNRVLNARMGVSLQPIAGGPAYIFRNELFNIDSEPIKMHNETTGFFIVHNTGVKHADAYSDAYTMWRNAILRNNLFLGTRYAFEFGTTADEGFRDLDYNAWGTSREIEDPDAPYFKWNNERYSRLGDLQGLGIELHGVEAMFSDLVNGMLPASYVTSAEPNSRDLRLVANSAAIDAGELLPNLNDGFQIDGLPDMGAFEFGQPLPHYGPRVVMVEDSTTAVSTQPTEPSTTDGNEAAVANSPASESTATPVASTQVDETANNNSTNDPPLATTINDQENVALQLSSLQLLLLIIVVLLIMGGGVTYGWWLGQR